MYHHFDMDSMNTNLFQIHIEVHRNLFHINIDNSNHYSYFDTNHDLNMDRIDRVDFQSYNLCPNNLLDIYIDNHSMYPNKRHYFDMVHPNRMNLLVDRIRHEKISDMNIDDNPVLYHDMYHHLNMEMIDMIEHE